MSKNRLQLIQDDPWLEPHEGEIEARYQRYQELLQQLNKTFGSLKEFASAHHYLGFTYDTEKQGWHYREWAPQAHQLFLIGDFNMWNRSSHPLSRDSQGVWEIFLPDKQYQTLFVHASKLKVLVHSVHGQQERIPAYIRRVVQDEDSKDFCGQHWAPDRPFEWGNEDFKIRDIKEPVIYECHVGMATEREGVGTYTEFKNLVLPRIKKLGYNTIQMMAVQEHPYYGSFGYHVSNFFAPCSRFGTPEELKDLIKTAHQMGIAVVMDLVHSHAVKNIHEGLNEFDGSDYQYFHAGGKGYHSGWDSKLFNYGKWEVMQFLLSNVRYWLEEFHFDGFRFDGVTSMLYEHHGNIAFNSYDDYYNDKVDREAVTYLSLANNLAHEIKPGAISIAEDVSGMPGLCRPVEEGGVGFDYRLAMGIPDFWIKVLKEQRDEDWNIWDFWSVMTNRRHNEKTIAYCESHDQALVGDKTIAFWLMDKWMYWHMQKDDEHLIIDRGIALHKMIRLFTIALGGEGYLNFMGNEFGHPEWVDFPREGNNWSFKHARRQWSLVDNAMLKYQFLQEFDKDMIAMVKNHHVLSAVQEDSLNMDEVNKVIIFKRDHLIFLFNFHPINSIENYQFTLPKDLSGGYRIVFNSDDKQYGGHGRVDASMIYSTDKSGQLSLYLTNRTALVLEKVQ
ncbi:alpha-amylase family glycosyl hydrolase [Rapidithrix thailandica]|uniref:1,4-alpha-glucan branching enzyme n=1 Tax=Rapidithrix thailandica TaxID=413964 RepID=A0AAW9SA61_9BACT